MSDIHFNNLRLTFWEDEEGEKTTSRPLTPKEVNQVQEFLHDILFGDEGVEKWEEFSREIQNDPGDPRYVEIDWDEEIIY